MPPATERRIRVEYACMMLRRVAWITAPAVLVAVALVAVFSALGYGGGADPTLAVGEDPGAVVRYGIPVGKLLFNLGASGTIGGLVLACFALDSARPEYGRALDVAAASAGVWTVASAFTAFITFVGIFEIKTFDDNSANEFGQYLTTTENGQAWLATTLIASGITVLCFAVRNQSVLAAVTVLAAFGLVPMSSQGHAGGTAEHDAASSAIFLHVGFAGAWLGGLLTIAILRRQLEGSRLVAVLTRYSTLALVCFLVVAASGYVSTEIRVGTLENLLTPYGILVLIKITALVALGLFGAAYRRVIIGRIAKAGSGGRGWFWWVTAELAFMGVASGVAAALARTATPTVEITAADLESPSPAEILTGAPLPPPPTLERYLTMWNFDLIWILVCVFGIAFYLLGVLRLRIRGDSWPWYRTALWILGMLLLFWITNGGVNAYQKYLFSAHMLAHMALGMMVPVLLVPGAPITLALRTIAKRDDGSRGVREWLLLVVHSRVFAILGNPIVAAVLFAGSLWAFYYTPLFGWATENHLGHQWMIVHFLGTGYLFVQSLIGVDPSPGRAPYPMRLLILLGTMAFHAFFGLALLSGTALLLADWYGAMGWGTSAIADQQTGGGIAWGVGELPTVTLAIVVAIMWARDDSKRAKRYDRKADRDGDAELEEYNAMLAKRAGAPTG
jgi:cytochrome c oxidase assembly factor CtaG/putative copper export protein